MVGRRPRLGGGLLAAATVLLLLLVVVYWRTVELTMVAVLLYGLRRRLLSRRRRRRWTLPQLITALSAAYAAWNSRWLRQTTSPYRARCFAKGQPTAADLDGDWRDAGDDDDLPF